MSRTSTLPASRYRQERRAQLQRPFDIKLSDHSLPSFGALRALQWLFTGTVIQATVVESPRLDRNSKQSRRGDRVCYDGPR
jgi:hypothetical protein